jgi:hypothetical protein
MADKAVLFAFESWCRFIETLLKMAGFYWLD